MNWVKSWFGLPQPVNDPVRLREALLAAAPGQLGRLCRANAAAIRQHFPSWQKIPDDVRSDPARTQSYVQGLVAVAQCFAGPLNDSSLMQRLTGTPESNPLLRWQNDLTRVRSQMAELDYAAAKERLTDLLIDVRNLTGSGRDRYLPITIGTLAECHFQTGAAATAVPLYDEALRLCEQTGDAEGVVAYLGNLYEAHRYLGHAGEAAGFADRLAAAFTASGNARSATLYRLAAATVRAGEPLNRVVAEVGDDTFEVDDLHAVSDQRVRFVFARSRITLRPAVERTAAGERLAADGRHDEAAELFHQAAADDPFDPHSRYQLGFSLLHLNRYADAADVIREVEQLAPGWFHCRADLWMAEQLAAGAVGHDLFLGLHLLEDAKPDTKQRFEIIDRLAGRYPAVPAVHHQRGRALAAVDRPAEAAGAFRHGLETADEPDIRTRLLVELANTSNGGQEKGELLREAVALNGNLVSAATARLLLRMNR